MPARALARFAAAVGAIVIAVTAYFLVAADRDRKAAHVTDRSEAVLSLQRLEDARRLGDSGLIYARNDPFLDPVRNAPRFKRLLQDIGFD